MSERARTLRVIEVAGSRRAMGESFGEALRAQIRELCELRLHSALTQAHQQGKVDVTDADLFRIAAASYRMTEALDPDTAEEMQGIARATALSIEHVMVLNGLTDLRDALSWWRGGEIFGGCTAVVAQGDTTSNGRLLCGQTWDLGTDNMPYVVAVRRKPSAGLHSIGLSIAGSLPFLGINEAGLAVGTTNLRTRDAQPGLVYVSLIDRALRCETANDALVSMTAVRRAGGHFFYVADAFQDAVMLECTAQQHTARELGEGFFVHANHCLESKYTSLDVDAVHPSTQARQRQMTALVRQAAGQIDAATLKSFCGNTSGAPVAICRDDVDGVSTNAAAILSPDERSMVACHGLPSHAPWVKLRV
jgi:isopenicillin-N N-acyltransferase like protein